MPLMFLARAARAAALLAAAWMAVSSARAAQKTAQEYFQEAVAAIREADLNSALVPLNQAIELEPKNPQFFFGRAQVFAGLREHQQAAEDFTRALALDPGAVAVYQNRGVEYFKLGRFKESVADFDKYLEKHRGQRPYHWQRGIALYYAGDYEEGRKQFELHQSVNSNDVENAVWHFLCVARLSGAEKARELLIPITGDPRVPMTQVHALFAGKGTVEDVQKAASAPTDKPSERKQRAFYANLYLGLYYEAVGDAAKARDFIFRAAEKYAENEYMGDVARVHAQVLAKGRPAEARPAAAAPKN